MAAWQQWMLNSVSELDFGGFVTVEFGENEQSAAALGSGSDVNSDSSDTDSASDAMSPTAAALL